MSVIDDWGTHVLGDILRSFEDDDYRDDQIRRYMDNYERRFLDRLGKYYSDHDCDYDCASVRKKNKKRSKKGVMIYANEPNNANKSRYRRSEIKLCTSR